MGVAQRLRDAVSDVLEAHNLVTGVQRRSGLANMGVGDVRGVLRTRVITLQGAAGTDTFKLRVRFNDGTMSADSDAFDDDETTTDIQAGLRTLTGDAGLLVTGNAGGPYTVTPYGSPHRDAYEIEACHCTGCSVAIESAAVTYDDAEAATSGNGINFDQESSVGRGLETPLGYSEKTDGTGQTEGVALLPPTIVTAIGGSGVVVIDGTEAASGGTSAVVLYSILNTDTGAWVVETQGVALEDADGDLTATGLAAGNYALFGHTQTAPGRVSRAVGPVYFTVV